MLEEISYEDVVSWNIFSTYFTYFTRRDKLMVAIPVYIPQITNWLLLIKLGANIMPLETTPVFVISM
jgi:hypothetical protein